ncbi:MAG TPA: hypothetical protein VL286_02855 [Rhizomicrobium sp.]|nr:hypothetical protein [Rhizomicrobium sp.]
MGSAYKLVFAIGAAALMVVAGQASADGHVGFHPPKSAAELALDKILKLADRDDDLLDNLLHRYPVAKAKQVDYRPMLTAQLLAAMQAEEKRLVKQDCGGKYLEGELCGMDYSPITCAQDTVAPYTYKTLAQTDRATTIAGPGATYRMIQVGSGWQLDGVKCETGTAFNFK